MVHEMADVIDTEAERINEFKETLKDLKFNSKPLIDLLTELAAAEHQPTASSQIVAAIEGHLQQLITTEQPSRHMLPVLYLVDSMVKNIGAPYVKLFAPHLAKTFAEVFRRSDAPTRLLMHTLRSTWNNLMPVDCLQELDGIVQHIDPKWPLHIPPVRTKNPGGVANDIDSTPADSSSAVPSTRKRSHAELALGLHDTSSPIITPSAPVPAQTLPHQHDSVPGVYWNIAGALPSSMYTRRSELAVCQAAGATTPPPEHIVWRDCSHDGASSPLVPNSSATCNQENVHINRGLPPRPKQVKRLVPWRGRKRVIPLVPKMGSLRIKLRSVAALDRIANVSELYSLLREPGLVKALYSGTQCAKCSARYASTVYEQHLDWHFLAHGYMKLDGIPHRKWYSQAFNQDSHHPAHATPDTSISYQASRNQGHDGSTVPGEQPVYAVLPDGPQRCEVCGDQLEYHYDEEVDEWVSWNVVQTPTGYCHVQCLADRSNISSSNVSSMSELQRK